MTTGDERIPPVLKRSYLDVLVIGFPTVDLVFSGLPHWPLLGREIYVNDFAIGAGGIFNTAAVMSRLGLQIGLLTDLGNDFFSRFILEEIERAGIRRDLITLHPTQLRSISICLAHEGERGFVSYADAYPQIDKVQLEDVRAHHALTGEDAIIYCRLQRLLENYEMKAVFMYAKPGIGPLLELFAERAIPVYFDTGWSPHDLNHAGIIETIKYSHATMPNQIEAMALTGTQDAENAARTLAEWTSTAIVKVGAQGVIASRLGELVRCPAYPVKDVIDTTGAGDAFNAGFIYGTLKGFSLPDALRCGTICGSLSTTALTGTAAVPTTEELENYLLQPF